MVRIVGGTSIVISELSSSHFRIYSAEPSWLEKNCELWYVRHQHPSTSLFLLFLFCLQYRTTTSSPTFFTGYGPSLRSKLTSFLSFSSLFSSLVLFYSLELSCWLVQVIILLFFFCWFCLSGLSSILSTVVFVIVFWLSSTSIRPPPERKVEIIF